MAKLGLEIRKIATNDNIISVDQSRSSSQKLIENGYRIEFHEYPMGHEICSEEISRIGNWIKNQLS